MRRFSRNIEVFDISLMAVVTKAMGAFLVLFVIVLPYYTGDPNVAATARAAREEIARLKRELDDLTRRIGAGPTDEAALRDAIRRMQAMLNESDARIRQLASQADALSSQLRRAQADLDQARKERDQARKEVDAAKAEVKQARLDAVELEVLANLYDRDRRYAMAANADGEETETVAVNALRHAAFAARTLVVDAWSWKSDCPKNGVSVFVLNDGDEPPEGVNMLALSTLGKQLVERVGDADLVALLGEPKAGEPNRAVRASPVWQGGGGRGVIVAHVPNPPRVSCRIDVSTTAIDVATRASKMLEQRDVELPASTEFVLLGGYDYTKPSARLSPPNDDDRAIWAKSKDRMSKQCVTNAKDC